MRTWNRLDPGRDELLPENVLNPDYGVGGIPHVVVIGPDGKVRQAALHRFDRLRSTIVALLDEFGIPTPSPAPPAPGDAS